MTRARSRIGFACSWWRRCSIGRPSPDGVTSAGESSRARRCRTGATSPAGSCSISSTIAYSLFGHSAGGQFLDRLAAFVPTEARRIVVANAGSYVFPSLEIDAPFGLGKVYSGTQGEAALRRYLEQPLTIYLGQGDIRDDERNDYPEALAQGASRFQRGVNVFNAAKTLAQTRGWPFNWRLVELPGVGHDARKMLAAPQAAEALSP
jgi:hypothetical protein